MDNWNLFAILISVILIVALILLYKNRIIDSDILTGLSSMIKQLPEIDGGSIFGAILKYSSIAVLTVEQKVKNGEIEKDNASRKTAAMKIVESAAKLDNIPFGEKESEIASDCIEAEVQKLPRNQ